MKKTWFVWIMIVLVGLSIIGDISSLSSTYSAPGATGFYSQGPVVGWIGVIVTIISLALSAVYFFKLIKMSPTLLRWTHITFAVHIVKPLLSTAIVLIKDGSSILGPALLGLLAYMPVMIVLVIIWVLFYKHLKKIFVNPVLTPNQDLVR